MFARATNTRTMKGTAAFQGLKSWASKLHQQLPLSTRESQRLLTALTSSFRQHLDEVHPPTATDYAKEKANLGRLQSTKAGGANVFHSSAVSADKHLASILTNPLLSKGSGTARDPKQDYANAMVELQKRHAKDPISLLEEYQERGIATVAIADLCLRKFKESTDGLSVEAVKNAVAEIEPGRRVLLWLFKSKRHDSAAFVDNSPMIDVLVDLLIKEGREQIIWEWLQQDMVLANDGRYDHDANRKKYYIYRWKGRVLRAIVASKLGSPNRELKRADDALDAFFKACDLRASASETSSNKSLPLAHAEGCLHRALSDMGGRYAHTDARKYDRLIRYYGTNVSGGSVVHSQLDQARLALVHPEKRTAKPMLRCYQMMFSDTASEEAHKVRLAITKPASPEKRHSWYSEMLQTASMLREEDKLNDANWLLDLVRGVFPEFVRYVDTDMQRVAAKLRPLQSDNDLDEPGLHNEKSYRVPFPTFT